VRLNGVVAAFTGGALVLVTMIVGLVPAASALKAGAEGAASVTGRTTEGRGGGRLRDALTVVEIALAVVLLVSAGLTARSLMGLLRVDLGFTTHRILAFKTNLTPQGYPDAAHANRFYENLTARLESLPGVTAVGAVSYLPLSGEAQYVSAAKVEDASGAEVEVPATEVGWRVVRGQYFEAMKMTLLRGRLFSTADREGAPPVVIVDDAFARRFWQTEEAALGQHIRFGGATNAELRTVVGVVRAVKHFGPAATTLPEAYAPQAQVYQRGMYSVVQANGPLAELPPLIRAKLAEVDSSVPMYFTGTLEQRRRTALTLPRFTAGLIGAFSVLALVLAGVGIFGVTAYSVGQRTREFGIRFSLGAQRSHVAGLVLKRVGWLALLGVALGIPAALGVARLMASLLFGVTPADLPTLAITAAGISLTLSAASIVPILRALRVDPMEALRAE
ncbi:MAG: ABC transporter permease, partial [Verrucomicrobiae bacterium]|nr:ABC transporter permease [Verrucomicrobiae bacterium]